MVDTLTVMRDLESKVRGWLSTAQVGEGWQVRADFGGAREADTSCILLRLVSCGATTPGLPTHRMNVQVILSKRQDTSAEAALMASEVQEIYGVIEAGVRALPGTDVESHDGTQTEVIAKYKGTRLEQLRSGILAESMALAPVAELALFVYFCL